jgi:hypothetical protein
LYWGGITQILRCNIYLDSCYITLELQVNLSFLNCLLIYHYTLEADRLSWYWQRSTTSVNDRLFWFHNGLIKWEWKCFCQSLQRWKEYEYSHVSPVQQLGKQQWGEKFSFPKLYSPTLFSFGNL